MRIVTKRQLTKEEIKDLEFDNKIVKHSKSNTIVLTKPPITNIHTMHKY